MMRTRSRPSGPASGRPGDSSVPPAAEWSLARILDSGRKLWVIVLTMMMVGGVGAYAYSTTVTPLYQSTSTLAFSAGQGSTAQDLANGSNYTRSQMPTVAQLATSSAVLEPVVKSAGEGLTVQDLKKSIVVTIPTDALVLQIQVTSPSARQAADLANGIAQSLTKVVRSIAPEPSKGKTSAVNVFVVDKAVPATSQSSPNKKKDAVLGALAGLCIGLAIALVWIAVDTRIGDEKALRRVTGFRILGSVPQTGRPGIMGTADEPGQPAVEELRRICSALSHAMADDRARSVLVCSGESEEGRTSIAASISLTLAGLGRRVLLIDADLRHPRLARRFDLADGNGLTDVVFGRAEFSSAVHTVNPELDLLPCGAVVSNPAEVLTSDRMQQLLDSVASRYEVVIIDSPPVLSVADANLLVPKVDGALVVADAKGTHSPVLGKTLANLEGAGGHILGLALNRTRPGSTYSLARSGNRSQTGPKRRLR